MKRSMLQRSTLREIKGSLGRFMAIFCIIALGVGFFAGVRSTTPSLVRTVNTFLEDKQLFDYRLVSSLGWDQESLDTFSAQDQVKAAEGSYTVDALFVHPDGMEFVLKTHSIPSQINLLVLAEGRMPRADDECLMDASMAEKMDAGSVLKVGDIVRLSDTNDAETLDAFQHREFRIVGAAYSSYYLNHERGLTSLGNGVVSAYLYLPPEAYAQEAFSEIFVRFQDDAEIYSKAYEDAIEARSDPWETLTQEAADARYERVLDDAHRELTDGREELEKNRAKGERELRDAERELADGKQELDDARKQLDDGKAELERSAKKIADGEQELKVNAKKLDDGEKELADAKKQLDDAEKQLADAKKLIDEKAPEIERGQKELDEAKAQLDAAKTQLDDAKEQLDSGKRELEEGKAQITAAEKELEEKEEELNDGEALLQAKEAEIRTALENHELPDATLKEMSEGLIALAKAHIEISEGKRAISEAWSKLSVKKNEISDGRLQLLEAEMQYQQGLSEYNTGLKQYNAGLKEFESGKAQYDKGVLEYETGLAKFENGKAEYERGVQELAWGRQQYDAGVKALEDGKKQYAEGLQKYEDGEKEYAEGLQKYEDGVQEYNEGKAEFDREIAKAERKIADAEKTVSDIQQPDSYVLDRYTNIGYTCFRSDSEVVNQVARVFPVFFLLVAAMVCVTTMSRMVEEQRMLIGTLKALGYTEAAIMGKFAFYSGSAAVLGCVSGFLAGTAVFPAVIWLSYQTMYMPLTLLLSADWGMALLSLAASLLCSIGTTWFACRIELRTQAAALMRPKAPRAGKRILLEYIPFLWRRLPFLHKVSIRNIFRYKGRFFMMVLGIGGCTALLVTGFGLRDTVGNFAEVQYNEIVIADAEMNFKNNLNGRLTPELSKKLDTLAEEYCLLYETSLELVMEDKKKSASIIVPMEDKDFQHFMQLHTPAGEPLGLPAADEAYISNVFYDHYNVRLGDTITLRTEDMQEVHVRVTGIFENHVYNYILLHPDTLAQQLGQTVQFNAAYVNFPEDADQSQIQTEFSKDEHVTMVSLFQEMKDRITNMMSALDYVVLLVILSAGGLAFVVLYNLTNINITERVREIATIKVLGFFKNETASYVLRENLVLTAIGILAGLVLGTILHRFVISQIVVDLVSFKVRILPLSYVWSVLLTFAFNAFVNFVMGFKLERINMAESLKSVD